MAKRKQADPGTITASAKDIEGCVAFHDAEKERADLVAENARAALEPLVEKGMRLDALKSAMRLRKLEPLARRAWFDSFEASCAALAIDAQLEMPLEASPGAPAPATLN
jgi:hypothetical protein